MSIIKISTSLTSFISITIISCFPVFADSNYTAVIQKINVRGDRLFTDNISKISSKTNILKLADTIGNTIDNQKFLPKISIPLGSIPFKILNKSLKAKGIQTTYSQYKCLSMRSQDDFTISLGISAILNRDRLIKSTLPVLVADRSFLVQEKPGSSSTGQPDKCRYSTINPAHFRQGDRNLQLNLSKQGYMTREIGFKIVAIEKMQPVLKFDDANLTLEDDRSLQTFNFLIDGGSQDLQEQITKRITKNHPRFYHFITNKSIYEILNQTLEPLPTQAPRSYDYPDYIIKLNVFY
jgi:hypothetical protein